MAWSAMKSTNALIPLKSMSESIRNFSLIAIVYKESENGVRYQNILIPIQAMGGFTLDSNTKNAYGIFTDNTTMKIIGTLKTNYPYLVGVYGIFRA